MTEDAFFVLRSPAPRTRFADLDRVELTADIVGDDGEALPAGLRGTVVGIGRSGAEYIVEFTSPVESLTSVLVGDLKAVQDERRARSRHGLRHSSCR